MEKLSKGVFRNSEIKILFCNLELSYIFEGLVNLQLYFLFLKLNYKLELLPLKDIS